MALEGFVIKILGVFEFQLAFVVVIGEIHIRESVISLPD